MVAARFGMPVFLYDEAATSASRRNLADIRRGEFEGLTARLATKEFVKALGINLPDRRVVQVSMNLTNYEETSLQRAFEAVEMEATQHGTTVLESEIVGLVPAAALAGVNPQYLKLAQFDERQILENRL